MGRFRSPSSCPKTVVRVAIDTKAAPITSRAQEVHNGREQREASRRRACVTMWARSRLRAVMGSSSSLCTPRKETRFSVARAIRVGPPCRCKVIYWPEAAQFEGFRRYPVRLASGL